MYEVNITWTPSIDKVQGYNVYEAGSSTPLNGKVLDEGHSYTALVSRPGRYSFYVTSIENGVESLHSNQVSVVVTPIPSSVV